MAAGRPPDGGGAAPFGWVKPPPGAAQSRRGGYHGSAAFADHLGQAAQSPRRGALGAYASGTWGSAAKLASSSASVGTESLISPSLYFW